jgi:hypothetical protein
MKRSTTSGGIPVAGLIGGDQRFELKTESGGLMNENQTCQMGGAHGDRAARMQALKTSVKTSFACISAP